MGVSTDNSQVRCFWRKMWSLPVPHKIRHFVWRSCRDILPMKTNLMRRKVVQDGICGQCRNKEETLGHVLWNCQKARETWEYSKVASFGLSNNVSFHDFLWQMLMHNRVEEDKVAKNGGSYEQEDSHPLGAVEAKAFEAGLLFAKDIGIQDLILEGDSITIHKAICETSTPPSSVEPVIEGMHTICKDFALC
ncbi:hypothetical protein SO802_021600 [Lithocarpus litseifolius]|uniref:Reverse transcriptase zinc-binding domain-containing protein n=1 Tax=Lithocarpus litseifolius TaxID=425828 RepID=A0AAW2CI96_9ROSI